ncbi:tetratricopeptide repeat protein [Flavobacterium sp. ZT3R17]|uniref:tetratricopeptide repeat protein n=1 Tax=Flavobacterium cryoconiti TaxID=3398736 RepID=UPI003A88C5C2
MNVSKKESIYNLKNNCSFNEICEITDEVNPKSNIINYIFGNPLPKSYEDLGFLKKNSYIGSSENILIEINWTLNSIRKFKNEILLFLEYRKIYEKAFLLGHYGIADEYLTKIETEICNSLWSLENRFMLLEVSQSPEAHKTFLSTFNLINKGFFTPSFAYFLSIRSEKNFSVLKFNNDIQIQFSRFRGYYAEANRQFYYLKLNCFENFNYSEYSEILAFDSYHSIIDRYLTLNKVLKLISTDVNKKEYFPFIISRINYLIGKFDDDYLKSIFIVSFPDKLKDFNDESFDLKTIDYYSSGLYSEAIDELKLKLQLYPSRFEYYLLYAKSFVYLKKELVLPTQKECFQNLIITEVYKQIGKNTNPQNSATNISRISKNLESLNISDGLHSFYDTEFRKNNFWTNYNLLSLSFENPLLSTIYDDVEQSKQLIDVLALKSQNSITIEYFIKKNNDDINKTFDDLNIPEHAKKVELAKFYQSKELFEKACVIWEELIKESNEIMPVLETAIRNLFDCYLKLNEIDKAISLFVNNYLINQFIIQKIDCAEIQNVIRKNKFRNVSPSIDLPIFYSISNADENEIHRTYELFNDYLGLEKSSEIDIINSQIDKNKFIIFFYHTCNPEVFKHSDYINGTKEGLMERISICRILQSIDWKNRSN